MGFPLLIRKWKLHNPINTHLDFICKQAAALTRLHGKCYLLTETPVFLMAVNLKYMSSPKLHFSPNVLHMNIILVFTGAIAMTI